MITINSIVIWILIWGTLIAWLVIGSLFLFDSIRVHMRSLREYRAAKAVRNGRLLVASKRKRISFWFLQGAAVGLFVGISSLANTFFLDPDSLFASTVRGSTRIFIVYMFFCFWRAKRTNWSLMTAADQMYQRGMDEARRQDEEANRQDVEGHRQDGEAHRQDLESSRQDAEASYQERRGRPESDTGRA